LNSEKEFSVEQYLSSGIENQIRLTVTATLDNGISEKKIAYTWKIKVVNLDVQWDFYYNENNFVKTNDFSISWIPKGGIDCVTHINFYNSEGTKVYTREVNVPANQTNKQ
jgi:hypothetical protein